MTGSVRAETTSTADARPANAGAGCVGGEPSLPAAARIASRAAGDFDGDGRPDRVEVINLDANEVPASHANPFYRSRPAVRVVFARGVSTPVQQVEEALKVIGTADLDGDRRDEVLLGNGGNTISAGTILVVHGCQFETVAQVDGRPYEFSYHGHGNCCFGSGAGFVCPRRGDRRDLIEVDYEPAMDDVDRSDGEAFAKALQRPDLELRWRRRTLRLEGTKVVVVSREEGRSKRDDRSVPIVNRFSCGGDDPERDPP